MWYFWISYSRMKRGGNFFSHFRGENKKGGQITFYSISSGGKKYAGRYVPVTTFSFTRPVEMFSLLWYVFMSFCIYEFSTGILTVFFFGVVSTDGKAKNNISLKNRRKRPFSLSFMWIFLADRYSKVFQTFAFGIFGLNLQHSVCSKAISHLLLLSEVETVI